MALEKPMYNPIAFSPVATLTSDIAVGSTVIPVSDVNAFPPAPSYATIGTDENAETIKYSAKTVDSLSGCTRAVEGVAQAWQTGEKIARNFTAADHQAIIDNLEQLNAGLQQAYSPNNKPTASDVGALPISGGTLTDSIAISKNAVPKVTMQINGTNKFAEVIKNATTSVDYGTEIYDYDADSNVAKIVLLAKSELSSKLRLGVTPHGGTDKIYNIFGEHNKSLLTENEKTIAAMNGSTNVGTIRYFKNADGVVYGNINNNSQFVPAAAGSWVTLCTLPSGYRPVSECRFLGGGNDNKTIACRITTAGELQVVVDVIKSMYLYFSFAFKSA